MTVGAGLDDILDKYLKGSGLLESRKDKLRLDVLPDGADESRLIEGIRNLISE